MAVGKTSLDDCEALTWSLGCTSRPSDRVASVAITSLAFMLLDVPDPVWKTSIGNCASWSPRATSAAASWIAVAMSASSTPSSALTDGSCALDRRERADQGPVDRQAGDREVLDRPLGLRPPQGVARDMHVAHRVVLDPEVVLGPGSSLMPLVLSHREVASLTCRRAAAATVDSRRGRCRTQRTRRLPQASGPVPPACAPVVPPVPRASPWIPAAPPAMFAPRISQAFGLAPGDLVLP